MKNTGNLPLIVNRFSIKDMGCEAYGFKIITCESFELVPEQEKDLFISYIPDTSLTHFKRELYIHTNEGVLEFDLEVQMPFQTLFSIFDMFGFKIKKHIIAIFGVAFAISLGFLYVHSKSLVGLKSLGKDEESRNKLFGLSFWSHENDMPLEEKNQLLQEEFRNLRSKARNKTLRERAEGFKQELDSLGESKFQKHQDWEDWQDSEVSNSRRRPRSRDIEMSKDSADENVEDKPKSSSKESSQPTQKRIRPQFKSEDEGNPESQLRRVQKPEVRQKNRIVAQMSQKQWEKPREDDKAKATPQISKELAQTQIDENEQKSEINPKDGTQPNSDERLTEGHSQNQTAKNAHEHIASSDAKNDSSYSKHETESITQSNPSKAGVKTTQKTTYSNNTKSNQTNARDKRRNKDRVQVYVPKQTPTDKTDQATSSQPTSQIITDKEDVVKEEPRDLLENQSIDSERESMKQSQGKSCHSQAADERTRDLDEVVLENQASNKSIESKGSDFVSPFDAAYTNQSKARTQQTSTLPSMNESSLQLQREISQSSKGIYSQEGSDVQSEEEPRYNYFGNYRKMLGNPVPDRSRRNPFGNDEDDRKGIDDQYVIGPKKIRSGSKNKSKVEEEPKISLQNPSSNSQAILSKTPGIGLFSTNRENKPSHYQQFFSFVPFRQDTRQPPQRFKWDSDPFFTGSDDDSGFFSETGASNIFPRQNIPMSGLFHPLETSFYPMSNLPNENSNLARLFFSSTLDHTRSQRQNPPMNEFENSDEFEEEPVRFSDPSEFFGRPSQDYQSADREEIRHRTIDEAFPSDQKINLPPGLYNVKKDN